MADINVICSINTEVLNKSADFSKEPAGWLDTELSRRELVEGVILKGHAINQSLFQGGRRCKFEASGGNLIIVDLDDAGLSQEILEGTPTYLKHGCSITHSCSSGVVATKPGVDGRQRFRITFLCERQFKVDRWTEDTAELKRNDHRYHLERGAIARHIVDNLCADLGIDKLKDECHKSVSQIFYGNDGITPVEWSVDGTTCFYPCSTDRRYHINETGIITSEQMDTIISLYRAAHPELLEKKEAKSAEELSKDALIVEWIFDNDILDETVLCDYQSFFKVGMAAKGIDDGLLDAFLGTLERFNDHYWRLPPEVTRKWEGYDDVSSLTIGTICMYADSCSPDWRQRCPYQNGRSGEGGHPSYPKLSHIFHLLKSNPSDVEIIFIQPLETYERPY